MKITKLFLLLIMLSGLDLTAYGQSEQQARWIWYPGDFEVWLHTDVGGEGRSDRNLIRPFGGSIHLTGLFVLKRNTSLQYPRRSAFSPMAVV